MCLKEGKCETKQTQPSNCNMGSKLEAKPIINLDSTIIWGMTQNSVNIVKSTNNPQQIIYANKDLINSEINSLNIWMWSINR